MRKVNTDQSNPVDDVTIEVEHGSGNVFADLGLPNADELKFKANLIMEIDRIIRARKLTQARASEIIGMDQPTLSKLLRGRFMKCSTDRLFEMLNRLGHGVEVVVSAEATALAATTVRSAVKARRAIPAPVGKRHIATQRKRKSMTA